MKKLFITFLLMIGFQMLCAATYTISYSISPTEFDETDAITITFTDINEANWGVSSSHALYLWAWSYDTDEVSENCPTNGSWDTSNSANKLTYVSDGKYQITFTPKDFFGREKSLTSFGFLVKTLNGGNQSTDMTATVGKFQMTLTNPTSNVNVLSAGSVLNIQATSNQNATYSIKANGTVVYSSSTASTSLSYNYTVPSGGATVDVTGTSEVSGLSKTESFVITNEANSSAIPSWIRQGINYDSSDHTKIGLALYAPGKDYVHVIGSFNNWTVSNSYLMKRDTSNTDLFWIEITGLTSQQIYTFQYRTSDGIKVADPYSRLVLSPDDDPGISSTTYPDLPTYPEGQSYDVSVVQTGMPEYNWTVTDFTKPAKEKLAVYELLVRDFTSDKNWKSLIDKIDYLKNLNINAVELLPVMEFEGNSSWGYNPSFHYALDKAYGTSDKFKEFIDLCHQNGIAVILDVAFNHATQRNPLVRLWSTSTTGGYGSPSSSNPYFNTEAKHAYNVNEDFNHESEWTQYYVERVLEQWLTEYKVDGFRWDLTKGFTQNCTASDTSCTDAYQADRVAILKNYADVQWTLDPSSYMIFEHLGTDAEEQEWANYKVDEGKGVIMWNKLTDPYNQNTMGYSTNSDFSSVDFENHGFTERRNIAYAESHDEERLMYKNLQYGNSSGSYNVKTLDTALERMKGIGAVLLAVPGPKMIWQFGELGYDYSINRCADETISTDCRTDPKPVAFTLGYDSSSNRKAIYETWAKILKLKNDNEVFNTKSITVSAGDLLPSVIIENSSIDGLNTVAIVANYTLTSQDVAIKNLPYGGIWYDLLNDNAEYNFASTSSTIALEPGEFKILGNSKTLGTDDVSSVTSSTKLKIRQNPATNGQIEISYTNAKGGTVYVYDISGKFIKSFKVSADSGNETLNVGSLKSGLYVLQLKSEKGSSVAKVIMK